MNHPWHPLTGKPNECITCHRNYMAHTPIATCDSCNFVGLCDINQFTSNMLLCANCELREVQTMNDHTIEKTKVFSDHREIELNHNHELVAASRDIDSSIRVIGDVFNARTIALSELKQAILSESSGTEQEKLWKYQNEVMTRYRHLKDVVFDLDNKKHEAVSEQHAIVESLRSFGNDLHTKIREELKESDKNYLPVIKVPKIVKPKQSQFDRLVEQKALDSGISLDEARELLTNFIKMAQAKAANENLK